MDLYNKTIKVLKKGLIAELTTIDGFKHYAFTMFKNMPLINWIEAYKWQTVDYVLRNLKLDVYTREEFERLGIVEIKIYGEPESE